MNSVVAWGLFVYTKGEQCILYRASIVHFSIGGNEQAFVEAIENAASVNTRLCIERKMRLPFLDSQTGVAQNHTILWHPYKDRQPGWYPSYHFNVDFVFCSHKFHIFYN